MVQVNSSAWASLPREQGIASEAIERISGVIQYRLTLFFIVVSSVIISVATFMVNHITGNIASAASIGGLLAGLLGFMVVVDVIKIRSNGRRLEREMEATKIADLQASRRRIVAAGEEVRKDIALRLHGSVQNRLILLMNRLSELESKATSEEIARELGALRREFAEVIQEEIRSISHQLYPSILRYGLIPAIQSLGDFFEEPLTIDIQLDEEFARQEKVIPIVKNILAPGGEVTLLHFTII